MYSTLCSNFILRYLILKQNWRRKTAIIFIILLFFSKGFFLNIYFICYYRFSDTSFIENNHINEDYESSSDDEMDIYLSKHILSTTIIENDSSNKQ